MKNKYSIQNFKIFDEEGVSVNFKPITILTGSNSSGKSSLVKSLCLLSSYLEDIKEELNREKTIYGYHMDLNRYWLDFTKRVNSQYGNMTKVLHNGNECNRIIFGYKVNSNYFGGDVFLKLGFGIEEGDELFNGKLHYISISKDNDLIYESESVSNSFKELNSTINANYFNKGGSFATKDADKLYKHCVNEHLDGLTKEETIALLKKEFCGDEFMGKEIGAFEASSFTSFKDYFVYKMLHFVKCISIRRIYNRHSQYQRYENEVKNDGFYRLSNTLSEKWCNKESLPFWLDYINELRWESHDATDDVVGRSMPKDLLFSYISSNIAIQKRIYMLDDTSELSVLFKDYYDAKYNFNLHKLKYKFSNSFEPGCIINKWMCKLDPTIDHVKVVTDPEGLGVYVKIKKKGCDSYNLLSEQGFGASQLFIILLRIETSVMKNINIDDTRANADLFNTSTIAIEEPESHLHPDYQSLLAELFIEIYKQYNVEFILETHSEYLIRNLQLNVAKNNIDANSVQIVYVNRNADEKELKTPKIKEIHIKKDGALDAPFGSGFLDETNRILRELVELKMKG